MGLNGLLCADVPFRLNNSVLRDDMSLFYTVFNYYYGRTLSERPCYILPMFFFIFFFIPALVGQTAERIFTKLSHVVDIRHHLPTTRSIYSWPSLNYTVGQKVTKFCIFFDPTRTFSALTPERGKISQF